MTRPRHLCAVWAAALAGCLAFWTAAVYVAVAAIGGRA